jgi:hypothetical protein
MSIETCGGYVPWVWETEDDQYFIRDDRDAGLSSYECYSLFRGRPDYCRVIVLAWPLSKVLREADKIIEADRIEWAMPRHMSTAPRNGTWIKATRKKGGELVVSWRKPHGLFLGKKDRWLTRDGKAGEVPFDRFVLWVKMVQP